MVLIHPVLVTLAGNHALPPTLSLSGHILWIYSLEWSTKQHYIALMGHEIHLHTPSSQYGIHPGEFLQSVSIYSLHLYSLPEKNFSLLCTTEPGAQGSQSSRPSQFLSVTWESQKRPVSSVQADSRVNFPERWAAACLPLDDTSTVVSARLCVFVDLYVCNDWLFIYPPP